MPWLSGDLINRSMYIAEEQSVRLWTPRRHKMESARKIWKIKQDTFPQSRNGSPFWADYR